MKKTLLVLGLALLAVLVLLVGNGVRSHLGPAPQAGFELGQGSRQGDCLRAAELRAQACESLFCGAGAGVFVASCLAVAEPDGSCEELELDCEGFACDQVAAQAQGVCEGLSL